MILGQIHGVMALVVAALPLGAIGLFTVFYAGAVTEYFPEVMIRPFMRHAAPLYCWSMTGLLLLAVILNAGWGMRITLAFVGGSFVVAALHLLPRLEHIEERAREGDTAAAAAGVLLRRLTLAGCGAQFLLVLLAYIGIIS